MSEFQFRIYHELFSKGKYHLQSNLMIRIILIICQITTPVTWTQTRELPIGTMNTKQRNSLRALFGTSRPDSYLVICLYIQCPQWTPRSPCMWSFHPPCLRVRITVQDSHCETRRVPNGTYTKTIYNLRTCLRCNNGRRNTFRELDGFASKRSHSVPWTQPTQEI